MTDTEQSQTSTRTRLHKRWVVRMVLITAALWAFGAWGFYDAAVKYPATGRAAAGRLQLEYLEAAKDAGRLYDAPIVDPVGELASLRAKDMLELSAFDRAKLDWLEVLDTPGLGLLNAEHTRMDNDPEAAYEALREQRDTKGFPPTLSRFDIVAQWGICAICWTLGAFMLVFFLLVRSKVYKWEPSTQTLTLPGGRRISPDDLNPEEPVDLHKWGKYIVTLLPKEGGPVRLDVFRYDHLEDWVRAMVKSRDPEFEFPDEAKEREAAEAAAAQESDDTPHPEAGDEQARSENA